MVSCVLYQDRLYGRYNTATRDWIQIREKYRKKNESKWTRCKRMLSFPAFMARWPFVVIAINICFSGLLGGVSIWKYGFPDFTDPQKGFEPRGTSIRGWEKAVRCLNDLSLNGNLTRIPRAQPFSQDQQPRLKIEHDVPNRRKRDAASTSDDDLLQIHECASWPIHEAADTPRIVAGTSLPDDDSNLMTADHLHALCQLEDKYILPHWPQCCRAHSLPLYVSALSNKTCAAITGSDVMRTEHLLDTCKEYYFDGRLHEDCHWDGRRCHGVPEKCYKYDAVFKILHYLTDDGYMSQDGRSADAKVTYSVLYLRREWYAGLSDVQQFFLNHLDNEVLENTKVKVVAMDLNIHGEVFNSYAVSEFVYFGVAMGLVIVLLSVYLRSVILMLAVVLNVGFTLLISYFIYLVVIRIHFFPFMNLLAGILLIAVGSDDTFIIYDLWRKFKKENPSWSPRKLTSETLRHGALSIFVTSLTTSAALFANVISKITAIRCFGIFAGVSILVNFVLMITWVPAVILVVEQMRMCSGGGFLGSSGYYSRCMERVEQAVLRLWGVKIAHVITKYWAVFFVLFLALGAAGVALIVEPGMTLPSRESMQFFQDEHPFEFYKKNIRSRLRFEVTSGRPNSKSLFAQVQWGVEGRDNGDYMDPENTGDLVWRELDVYTPQAQEWHIHFCQQLKKQGFIKSPEKYACYFELFRTYMEGPCERYIGSIKENRTLAPPCCQQTYPFDAGTSRECISNGNMVEMITRWSDVVAQGRVVLGSFSYEASSGDAMTFANVFETTSPFSPTYSETDALYESATDFLQASREKHLSASLQEPGFVGVTGYEFAFYDVQRNLVEGTYSGILFALILGFFVLLLTSLNILITVYAMVTIGLSIAVTVGTLILMGWELNITESLIITLSVGLSIDFTIHYGVAYKLSQRAARKEKVTESLATVGSAVTMSALSTVISGLAVLPSRIIVYQQFGTFLVLIMISSWLFATCFFLSLCSIVGPMGTTGDLRRVPALIGRLLQLCSSRIKGPRPSPPHSDNTSTESGEISNASSRTTTTESLNTISAEESSSKLSKSYSDLDVTPQLRTSNDTNFWRGAEGFRPPVFGRCPSEASLSRHSSIASVYTLKSTTANQSFFSGRLYF